MAFKMKKPAKPVAFGKRTAMPAKAKGTPKRPASTPAPMPSTAGKPTPYRPMPEQAKGTPQRPAAPGKPASPGKSAQAPGQLKKAAGVQSAKQFAPGQIKKASSGGSTAPIPPITKTPPPTRDTATSMTPGPVRGKATSMTPGPVRGK